MTITHDENLADAVIMTSELMVDLCRTEDKEISTEVAVLSAAMTMANVAISAHDDDVVAAEKWCHHTLETYFQTIKRDLH
jgi:hypothetical protein